MFKNKKSKAEAGALPSSEDVEGAEAGFQVWPFFPLNVASGSSSATKPPLPAPPVDREKDTVWHDRDRNAGARHWAGVCSQGDSQWEGGVSRTPFVMMPTATTSAVGTCVRSDPGRGTGGSREEVFSLMIEQRIKERWTPAVPSNRNTVKDSGNFQLSLPYFKRTQNTAREAV